MSDRSENTLCLNCKKKKQLTLKNYILVYIFNTSFYREKKSKEIRAINDGQLF